MVLVCVLTSTASYESDSSFTNITEHTSLTLNQLIREGVSTYLRTNKKQVGIELRLADELKRTAGEPAQLRRVFTQMVNCVVESTNTASSHILFETKNITFSSGHPNPLTQHEYLSPGTYVSLRIEINDGSSAPNEESWLNQPDGRFNPFVWSQICEVLEVRGGAIIEVESGSLESTETSTIVNILLPALDS